MPWELILSSVLLVLSFPPFDLLGHEPDKGIYGDWQRYAGARVDSQLLSDWSLMV